MTLTYIYIYIQVPPGDIAVVYNLGNHIYAHIISVSRHEAHSPYPNTKPWLTWEFPEIRGTQHGPKMIEFLK